MADDSDTGYGCYSMPDAPMQCTCNDSVCSNETCTSANGTWMANCKSCTCDEGNESTDEGNEDDGDDSTGWGCYDITVHVCGCAPEFCSEETCEKAGGIFTDGCGTCMCEEVFSPGNTIPPDIEPTMAPTPATDVDETVEPTPAFATASSGPTEATTEAPSQATTEAPSQTTTDAPSQATTETPSQATAETTTESTTSSVSVLRLSVVLRVVVIVITVILN
jgi:hypothetical protein